MHRDTTRRILFVILLIVVLAVTSYQDGATGLGVLDRWPWIRDAVEWAKAVIGLANVDLRAMAISGIQTLGSLVADEGPALVGGALGLLFSFLVMLFAMPMLFANSERLTQAIAESLPIPAADGRRIIGNLSLMTRSVFTSVGLTVLAQALLGGLALLVLGVPQVVSLTASSCRAGCCLSGCSAAWPRSAWSVCSSGRSRST